MPVCDFNLCTYTYTDIYVYTHKSIGHMYVYVHISCMKPVAQAPVARMLTRPLKRSDRSTAAHRPALGAPDDHFRVHLQCHYRLRSQAPPGTIPDMVIQPELPADTVAGSSWIERPVKSTG